LPFWAEVGYNVSKGAVATANGIEMKYIARIRTDFATKFGVPRQSGLVPELRAKIIFESEFKDPDFIDGLGEFSHLWLIWGFSENEKNKYSPKVSPPRLGGEKRGVFATRSPFRPNSIGLSSVKIESIDYSEPSITVLGADMTDGTPIYDIKPYLPYTDSHPDASGGFGEEHRGDKIEVVFPKDLLNKIPASKRQAIIGVLSQDPRAAYNKAAGFIYGMTFSGFDVRFTVKNNTLTVCDVVDASNGEWKKIK